MSVVEVDDSRAKHDVSNDVGGINRDERKANTMDVTPVGNGQPEENSSPVVVKTKPVVDIKPQSDINTTKREEHDTNGSASPVKRKQFREKSDSEMDDGGSPTKKQRSEKAKHSSDEGHADKSAEHIHSTAKPSPKKQKQTKEKADTDDDDDEEEEELAPGLLERPVVIEEGQKREKKKVQRLEVTAPSANKQKRLSLEEGSGEKLGDIPRVEFQLQKTHYDDLKPLHRLLFERVASSVELKKNIRRFSGFAFSADSAEKKKKLDKLTKYTVPMLKSICETLDIDRVGKKDDVVERIINFLMEPKSSGKPLPTSKKRKRSSSKPKKGGDSKGSAKKSKVKKSKSDSKETKESGGESDADDESDKSAADSDEEEEKPESPKPAKKKKKDKTPAKKTPKAVKKTPKSSSAKKVKKPSKKSKASSGESSDDDADEPLVKKKVPPTDDMLKNVVKKILKTANLEEVTMKTVCKQVYEKFPDFDLTSRKDFIKATVKQILK